MRCFILGAIFFCAVFAFWRLISPQLFTENIQGHQPIHRSVLQRSITSLDPVQAADTNTQLIINNSFDGLVAWSFKDGISGKIAKTWDVSEDGLRYTFWLREDVLFHDGTHLEAKDVVEAFNHLLKAPSYFRDHYQVIANVKSVGKSGVEIRLRRKYPNLLLLLSGVGAKIVLRRESKILGSGPFIPSLEERRAVLNRFDRYWGNAPGVTTIEFTIMTEKEVIEAARMEKVDDTALVALSGDEISSGHGTWMVQPMWATWAIAMDQRVEPFSQVEIRREFVSRLPSTEFVRRFYPEHEIAFGLIPFGVRGFADHGRLMPKDQRQAHAAVSVEVLIPSDLKKAQAISDWIVEAFRGSWLSPKPLTFPPKVDPV